MAYTESLVSEHLRRISVDDYEYGSETQRKNQVEHIIFTVLTQLNSAVQLALESEDAFDTIYGIRTIGEDKLWLELQETLIALAENQNISLDTKQIYFNTISNYFIRQHN